MYAEIAGGLSFTLSYRKDIILEGAFSLTFKNIVQAVEYHFQRSIGTNSRTHLFHKQLRIIIMCFPLLRNMCSSAQYSKFRWKIFLFFSSLSLILLLFLSILFHFTFLSQFYFLSCFSLFKIQIENHTKRFACRKREKNRWKYFAKKPSYGLH